VCGGGGGEDARDDVEGNEKQTKHGSAFNNTPGGTCISGGMSGKRGGQGVGHKVATFFLYVPSQVTGVGGVADPIDLAAKGAEGPGNTGGSDAVFEIEFGSIKSPAVADHREEEGLSQAGSMSTTELEKALGNMSQ
jgi:hypothetical protein